MKINPLLLVDFYKIHHTKMYPENMTKLYSNWTPRASRIDSIQEVVTFGIQHFVQEYLIDLFNKDFFGSEIEREFHKKWPNISKKHKLIEEYKRHCNVDTSHIEALWDLGYLPIEIKALEEGTLCPIGVPMLTITNTHPDFAWLVNYLESLLSCMLWQPMTSATIAHEYKKILTKYALETDETNIEFINWQGHDFSMRGMSSIESSVLSGMGHLLSFTGSDNIPAIYVLENSYFGSGLIGSSIPATEHSVMCMGTKEDELLTFRRLMELYPKGPLSIVSDTWNLWDVATIFLPQLKDKIMARDGKLVIRPDSGNPIDILCGTAVEGNLNFDANGSAYPDNMTGWNKVYRNERKYYILSEDEVNENSFAWKEIHPEPQHIGLVEILWNTFGGILSEQGYRVLDSHIGAIYGDSITLSRAEEICQRLKDKGFASTNVVFGIGSYTYQYNTRDVFGFAMKATYGEISHKVMGRGLNDRFRTEERKIWKDPITDDGTKKSKKGLLRVTNNADGDIICVESQTYAQEQEGLLRTVFLNGKLVRKTTLEEIRSKLLSEIYVDA